MKNIIIILTLIIMVSCSNAQKSVKFSFDNTNLSKTKIWSTHITGKGNPCKWVIINDNGNNVLAQTSQETEDYRFNIIINDSLKYKDMEINVRFKAEKGDNDQGGGPVWRYKDENNYYVARANPLENNFRLYKVINGRRIQLKSSKITMQKNKWYNIKIIVNGEYIKCYFNNSLEMETTDNSLKNYGKIGLWTKSDAVTYFDDLKISTINKPNSFK